MMPSSYTTPTREVVSFSSVIDWPFGVHACDLEKSDEGNENRNGSPPPKDRLSSLTSVSLVHDNQLEEVIWPLIRLDAGAKIELWW